MTWLDGITYSKVMSLSKLWEMMKEPMGLQRAGHELATKQQCDLMKSHILKTKATFYLFSNTWSQIGYTK